MNNIPNGYKQTEVGVIPEEWEVKPISSVAPLQRGFDLPTSQLRNGPYPVVYSNGVLNCHNKAMVVGPGVVTGRSGTIGKVNYIETDYWPHNTTLWVTGFKGNDPKFIYYLYQDVKLERFGTGSGVPTLNRNDVHAFRVRIPPLPEQRAIAATLSDVDALLAKLDQFIAKKRDLKQAAMQQLLTGQTRLPGFSGEWEVKRLGDLVDVDPENLGGNTAPDYAFNYISLEDVDSGVLRGYSEQVFHAAPSRARRKLQKGDILVSTVRPNLKSHLLFTIEAPHWVCSTGFSVVRCREGTTHPGYMFFHLFGDCVSRQIEMLLTGSNYPAINSGDVRALRIPFPEYAEQTAIAEILSDMDAEIAALETRRDKTKLLKQGMMQELLTGRIRLV